MTRRKKVKREMVRLFRGELHTAREFLLVLLSLALISATCFALCWEFYPHKAAFSMMENTISTFGKPDKSPDPSGQRFFQLGFATLCFMLCVCAGHRQRCLRSLADPTINRTTALYLGGILCLMLSLFFPDTGLPLYGKIKYRLVHGIVVIVGIVLFVTAITRDAWLIIRRHRQRKYTSAILGPRYPKVLIPFALFIVLFVVALVCWLTWEVRCALDSTLDHWPGEGIHSLAMWEWILFSYLFVFMCWFNRLLRGAQTPMGGIASLHTWKHLP